MPSTRQGFTAADARTQHLVRARRSGPFANGVERLPPGEERTKAQQRLDGLYANLRYARQLGIRIGAGYDPAERALHGTNARELIAMGAAGLSNAEVLRAATLSNATLMGMDDRIGSIKPASLRTWWPSAAIPWTICTRCSRSSSS
jgi:imidazolonepropionase-like amidohydrolase